MKLPFKGIRMGAWWVTLRSRTKAYMANACGYWHADEQAIDYVQGMRPFDERDTVLHEIFHAILSSQGREYGGEVEETYVRALATGLTHVIHTNPEFAKWLTSPLEAPP